MRSDKKDSAEMVNQLVFGEAIEIIDKDANWIFIKSSYDGYEGWIDEKQINYLSQKDHSNWIENSSFLFSNHQQISTPYGKQTLYSGAFVGKTTTAINLGGCLGVLEYKTLIIDADPQANSTSGNGFDPKNSRNIYDCLVNGVHPKDLILNTANPNLDILPSHMDLVGAEIEMINMPNREYLLKKALEKVKDEYDFILIDCSPSLGLITVNSIVAADSVMIPVQSEYFALEGLTKLLNTIKIIQGRLNPELEIEGILLTMYDTRLRMANQVVDEVKTHFQELVFDTVIHRNTTITEASSYGKTVIMYDAASKGSTNYLNFAREILQKNNLTKIGNDDKKIEIDHEL